MHHSVVSLGGLIFLMEITPKMHISQKVNCVIMKRISCKMSRSALVTTKCYFVLLLVSEYTLTVNHLY